MAFKPLKIWILEIGEPLPLEPNVRLHRYGVFSKWLASQGHQVTWWTSSFSHAPKKNFVNENCQQVVDGVRMKFIFGKGYPRNISLARIRHQADFARQFLIQAEIEEKPDVILAPIPTIDGATAAVQFASKHGIPVIADIRDLWPDEIRDLAPSFARGLAEVFLIGAYRKLRYVCSEASAICGVSRSYLDYGLKHRQRRVEKSVDFIFPLGYSPQKIAPDKLGQAETWFANLKIPASSFVSCFFGTIGKFFDLSTVIESARDLGEDFYFVLGGDGSSLEQFREQARGLKNVLFPGWLDAAQIQVIMKHSAVGLAPYSREAKMSLPNKPFEYMSAGLPIVSSIQYELKEILAARKAGLSYWADSKLELCGALKTLEKDPDLRREMGLNSLNLFEQEFSTEKVFARSMLDIQRVVENFGGK